MNKSHLNLIKPKESIEPKIYNRTSLLYSFPCTAEIISNGKPKELKDKHFSVMKNLQGTFFRTTGVKYFLILTSST